jgi:hypothetical protein
LCSLKIIFTISEPSRQQSSSSRPSRYVYKHGDSGATSIDQKLRSMGESV